MWGRGGRRIGPPTSAAAQGPRRPLAANGNTVSTSLRRRLAPAPAPHAPAAAAGPRRRLPPGRRGPSEGRGAAAEPARTPDARPARRASLASSRERAASSDYSRGLHVNIIYSEEAASFRSVLLSLSPSPGPDPPPPSFSPALERCFLLRLPPPPPSRRAVAGTGLGGRASGRRPVATRASGLPAGPGAGIGEARTPAVRRPAPTEGRGRPTLLPAAGPESPQGDRAPATTSVSDLPAPRRARFFRQPKRGTSERFSRAPGTHTAPPDPPRTVGVRALGTGVGVERDRAPCPTGLPKHIREKA